MAYLIGAKGKETHFSGDEETQHQKSWAAAYNFQAAIFRLIDQAAKDVKADQQPREIWGAYSSGIRQLVTVPLSQRERFIREDFDAALMVKISPETDVEEMKATIRETLPAVYRRYLEVN